MEELSIYWYRLFHIIHIKKGTKSHVDYYMEVELLDVIHLGLLASRATLFWLYKSNNDNMCAFQFL